MTRAEKFNEEVLTPLLDAHSTLEDALNTYGATRYDYEETPHNADVYCTYLRTKVKLIEAHRQWKKLFSELTQARRL